MKNSLLAVIAAFMFLSTVGCAREEARERVGFDNDAYMRERDEYVGTMETRLNELENRYNTWMQANPTNKERAEYLRREIDALRADINELKNTTYENWWTTRRGAIDREYGDINTLLD